MKLTHTKYEEYLFLTRDAVISRKRNLDAVVAREDEAAETTEMAGVLKRIRGNKALFRPFQRFSKLVSGSVSFRQTLSDIQF